MENANNDKTEETDKRESVNAQVVKSRISIYPLSGDNNLSLSLRQGLNANYRTNGKARESDGGETLSTNYQNGE